MMKYDDASWHAEGDFPDDLPAAASATHIGMYLVWALLSGLASEEFLDDFEDDLDALKARETTPGELLAVLDGKFSDEELCDGGNAFTKNYFKKPGAYLKDYKATLGDGLATIYHIPDTWETFDKLKPVLDKRFADWLKAEGRAAPQVQTGHNEIPDSVASLLQQDYDGDLDIHRLVKTPSLELANLIEEAAHQDGWLVSTDEGREKGRREGRPEDAVHMGGDMYQPARGDAAKAVVTYMRDGLDGLMAMDPRWHWRHHIIYVLYQAVSNSECLRHMLVLWREEVERPAQDVGKTRVLAVFIGQHFDDMEHADVIGAIDEDLLDEVRAFFCRVLTDVPDDGDVGTAVRAASALGLTKCGDRNSLDILSRLSDFPSPWQEARQIYIDRLTASLQEQ